MTLPTACTFPQIGRASADLLVAPPRKPLDVGFVISEFFPEGRYFGNGVGIGFDAVVGFVAARSKLSGIMSYLVAAIKTIYIFYTAPKVRVELDDREPDPEHPDGLHHERPADGRQLPDGTRFKMRRRGV